MFLVLSCQDVSWFSLAFNHDSEQEILGARMLWTQELLLKLQNDSMQLFVSRIVCIASEARMQERNASASATP